MGGERNGAIYCTGKCGVLRILVYHIPHLLVADLCAVDVNGYILLLGGQTSSIDQHDVIGICIIVKERQMNVSAIRPVLVAF